VRIVRSAIIFGLVLGGFGAPVFSQQNVGFVLELQGKWSSGKDHRTIRLGQQLQGGLVLENPDPADGDHIVVANLRGEVIKTIRCKSGACRECTEAGGCYDPIHSLPNAMESPGALSTVLNAVVELLLAKPERYSVHRVRGAENSRTGVVQMQGDTVDIDSLLLGEEAGTYEFQFIPLSEKTHQPNPTSLFGQTKWNPGAKAILNINGIEPGLYEVRFDHGTTTGNAWILVCSGADYRDRAVAFQEFVHQTESWSSSVTQSTRQTYQRAYLEYLNLQTVRSAK